MLRLALTMYDNPEQLLSLATYFNIADPKQRSNAAALVDQDAIPMFFYNETLYIN